MENFEKNPGNDGHSIDDMLAMMGDAREIHGLILADAKTELCRKLAVVVDEAVDGQQNGAVLGALALVLSRILAVLEPDHIVAECMGFSSAVAEISQAMRRAEEARKKTKAAKKDKKMIWSNTGLP